MALVNLLQQKPSFGFGQFLNRCSRLGGINVRAVAEIERSRIAYLAKNKDGRDQFRTSDFIETKWYKSLAAGHPDFTIYDDDLYLGDLWACWVTYSRKYLLGIASPNALRGRSIVQDLLNARRITDLGCGIGYTTAALKTLFPVAKVIGTNLENTVQIKFARELGREYGFTVLRLDEISAPVDLVFASEYFEHFQRPIDHLLEVLQILQPTSLLIANTFGTKSIGHFDKYDIGHRTLVDGKKTSRIFNNVLREVGLTKIETTLWNNRPAYWKNLTQF